MTSLARWDLPRAIPSASGLDVIAQCPGSRELPQEKPVTTPAMTAGIERHKILEAWVLAGCPQDDYPVPIIPKNLSPVSDLPRIARMDPFQVAAEVQMWVDPVSETAGIICYGRRPEEKEYPEGVHIFSGGADAVGLVTFKGETLPGVVEWKSRTRSIWQVHMAVAAAYFLLGKPERMVAYEFFHPSGIVEPYTYGEPDIQATLAWMRLRAMELLAQRMGYPPRFQTGPACSYCKSYNTGCPLKDEARHYRAKGRQ